ncbi:HlyD family efflux transporter periplasmic adaptor subunit [Candidatus Rariloculus sp.]|uniref:HlyD family efflux transporter periplasmic adaptor subunit n=1 Tax=Candidatus Rariloculus sp. TaxID=3101265 RepID=UPI003D125D15
MINSPFRKEALDTRDQRQQLDRLLRVAAPHERIMLAVIGTALLALVAWALVGSVPYGVTVEGVLIRPGIRHEAVAEESGQLLELLVRPGDRVAPGGAIARQSVPGLDREIAALRERVDLWESESGPAVGDATSFLPDSVRQGLLQMEARRSARELIVSQPGGEVMALRAAPGQFLSAGSAVAQIREGELQPLKAIVRVAPNVAQRVEPGMRASVEIVMPGEAARVMDGEITLVTEEPLPNWLGSLLPAAASTAPHVEVVLDQASEIPATDGARCRVRIVLGQYAPAALFNLMRS